MFKLMNGNIAYSTGTQIVRIIKISWIIGILISGQMFKKNLFKLAICSNHKAFELFEFDMKFVSNLQNSQKQNCAKFYQFMVAD